MALWILRGLFLLIAIGMGLSLTVGHDIGSTAGESNGELARWAVFVIFILSSVGIVVLDICVRSKRIDMISSVYFGLVVGLFLTYVVDLALKPLFGLGFDTKIFGTTLDRDLLQLIIVSFAGISLCYSCISLLWQTRDDFRFVIPYVEFSKDVKGSKPLCLRHQCCHRRADRRCD